MFGEKPMYGHKTVHSDKKGRVSLPVFTGAETNDELVIIKDSNNVRVVRQDVFDEYIAYLEGMLKKEIDQERIKLIQDRITNICEKILKSATCDKNHRILASCVLDPETDYLVIGCRTSLIIKNVTKDITQEENLKEITKQYKPEL